ncbi:MAG: four helix bundle protein [Myxococcales bacterium]|nr:four helix bundle protein [Myxococcales bacterium]
MRTNQPLLALELSHEMLDHLAPLLRGVAKHDRSLADQLRRAAQSVTLNLAESAGHHGGHRRLRHESALGSAYETRACQRIARSWGYVAADATADALALVDRVAAMTYRLLRPRQ